MVPGSEQGGGQIIKALTLGVGRRRWKIILLERETERQRESIPTQLRTKFMTEMIIKRREERGQRGTICVGSSLSL